MWLRFQQDYSGCWAKNRLYVVWQGHAVIPAGFCKPMGVVLVKRQETMLQGQEGITAGKCTWVGKRAGVWYASGGMDNIEVPSIVMGRQSLWGIDECKWVNVMGECVLFVSHFSRSFTEVGSKTINREWRWSRQYYKFGEKRITHTWMHFQIIPPKSKDNTHHTKILAIDVVSEKKKDQKIFLHTEHM